MRYKSDTNSEKDSTISEDMLKSSQMKFPNYRPEQWRKEDDERRVISKRVSIQPLRERWQKFRLMKRLFDDLSEFSKRLRKAVGL